ncbi:MAG: hypothetical protein KDK30_10720, partial [Leptospiraceae bacterium]|nr:hypothetical protein [Leptospiraceae bacterium]
MRFRKTIQQGLLFLGIALLPQCVQAHDLLQKHVELNDWKYRWQSESDFSAAVASSHLKDWRTISAPRNPPHRNQEGYLWLQARLPDFIQTLDEPTLLLQRVDQNFIVIIDDKQIYKFGRLDPSNERAYIGTPFHLIPLKREYAGQHIQLQIYSEYTSIGIQGPVRIGNRGDLILKFIRDRMFALLS